jgi:hypothetical protein
VGVAGRARCLVADRATGVAGDLLSERPDLLLEFGSLHELHEVDAGDVRGGDETVVGLGTLDLRSEEKMAAVEVGVVGEK